jgi:hypothetical protein
MTKLIQICASRNDLFALDDEGQVHQYNFSRKVWAKLVADRRDDQPSQPEGLHNDESVPSREKFRSHGG